MSDSPSDSYEGEKDTRIYIHESQIPPPPSAPEDRKHNNSDNDREDDVHDSQEYELMFCTGHVTDKRLWILALQSIISLAIIFLCCIKLFDDDLGCESSNLYTGLIALITGIWFRSPID